MRTWRVVRMGIGCLSRRTPDARGQYLREHFASLGGLWVKVGQLLSLRLDLFPTAFCHALSTLQGHDGLGSVAQVTREKVDGRWCAVKRRLPGAVESFSADLALVTRLAWWSRWFVPRLRLRDAVEELRRVVAEELDFRFEASSMRRMRKTLKPHGIHVPKVYRKACSDAVLVSEWVEGLVMTEYLALSPAEAARWRRKAGVQPKVVARLLIASLFRQVFEDDLFHSDLHPGNIILGRDNRVTLIDFGTVGTTEAEFLATFRDQVRAMVTGEYAWAAGLTLLLCAGIPADRQERTKAALVVAMQAVEARTHIKSLPYHEKSLNAYMTAMMQIVLAARGRFNWAWLRIQRTFTTLDATLAALYPTINYPKVVRAYFVAYASRNPFAVVREAGQLLERLPLYIRLETARLQATQIQVKVGL